MESSSINSNMNYYRQTSNPKKCRSKNFSLITLTSRQDAKILLVEGKTDTFYTDIINKFLTTSLIKIHPVSSLKEYVNEEYDGEKLNIPKNAKEYVKKLVEKQLKKEEAAPAIEYGKCFGLIDKDFDFKEDDKKKYNGRLECTDCTDLETTLLFYDYENIESSFYNDFNRSGENFDILGISINCASKIGKLRIYKEKKRSEFEKSNKKFYGYLTKSIKIDFKDKENNSDGYYNYISESGNFDFDAFIGHNDKIDELKELKNQIYEYDENNLLSYCRGHDIFDFITCFYKKADRIKKEYKNSTVGENKILALRSKYEVQMEECFDKEKFKATRIYSFFLKINNS